MVFTGLMIQGKIAKFRRIQSKVINGVEELCTSEYYTEGDWDRLSNAPIWVKRDKDFGLFDQLMKKVKRVVKFLIRKVHG